MSSYMSNGLPPKKLSIIVPYRNRADHLSKFIPRILRYFKHDKIDCNIPFSVTIVCQTNGGLFNAGMLRNIGFDLTREFDYHVFHDVDYLPVWADYQYSDQPARLIWYGAEMRAVVPGGEIYNKHIRKNFRGGVIMAPKKVTLKANGYSNTFWGWGYQDTDFALRCIAEGAKFELRDGYYEALDHVSRGFDASGAERPRLRINRAKFLSNEKIMSIERPYKNDGLTTLKYDVLQNAPWNVDENMKSPNFLFGQNVTVHLPGQEGTGEEEVEIEAPRGA